MTDQLEETAQKIADRGREALIARLRPAFEEAAAAHSDVLQLGPEQLDSMVERAVERADGLQWRRALASVATEELGITLGEALAHPAVARAQELVGAPSYEDSLAQLGPLPGRTAAAPASEDGAVDRAEVEAEEEAVAEADEEEAEDAMEEAEEEQDGFPEAVSAEELGAAVEDEEQPVEAEDEPIEEDEPEAVDEEEPDEAEDEPIEEDEPEAVEEEPEAIGEEEPEAVEEPDDAEGPPTAEQPALTDEADDDAEPVAAPAAEPEDAEPEDAEPEDEEHDDYYGAFDDEYDEGGLRVAVVHLGGIANLAPAERDIELQMTDEGLDIIRAGGEILGRLEWDQVTALEVPIPRRGRRMRRGSPTHLVVRTERGDASFEVPEVAAGELQQHLAPIVARHVRRD